MDHENRHMTMKDLPASERPYEKCENNGPGSLSDAELLSIIIKSGFRGNKAMDVACMLLNAFPEEPGLAGLLKLELNDLRAVDGIGRVKSIQIAAAVELSKRLARVQFTKGRQFTDPDSVAAYYMPYMRDLAQEELHMMMLDTKQRMITECLLTKGTVNCALIEARDIFIRALRENAVGIILVHNHPSGDTTPSREDFAATKRVRSAGELIGISLLDHLIIGNGCYKSIYSEMHLKKEG